MIPYNQARISARHFTGNMLANGDSGRIIASRIIPSGTSYRIVETSGKLRAKISTIYQDQEYFSWQDLNDLP